MGIDSYNANLNHRTGAYTAFGGMVATPTTDLDAPRRPEYRVPQNARSVGEQTEMRYEAEQHGRRAKMSRWILLVTTCVCWLNGWDGTRAKSTGPEPAPQVTYFDAAHLRPLRKKASEVAPLPADSDEGWSKSETDMSHMLIAFQPLSVKPGVVLRAFQFREGGNGTGIVWALPTDADFPEPARCPLSPTRWATGHRRAASARGVRLGHGPHRRG